MKKIFISCTALLLTLAFISGCGFIAKTTPTDTPAAESPSDEASESISPTPTPETTEPEDNVVSVKTDRFEYTSDYITVEIELPQITGIDDSIQTAVNKEFDRYMSAARSDITSMEDESKELSEEGMAVGAYELYISYTVPYNNNGIISIVVSDYRYIGGAHGGVFRTAYNYDLNNGKPLTLEDMMNDGSGFRDTINGSIRSEIDSRVQNGELYELATFEDIGDTPSFYITDNAIVFYFQEYEYFPYAAGIQEFPIMYTSLHGILKEEYSHLSIVELEA